MPEIFSMCWCVCGCVCVCGQRHVHKLKSLPYPPRETKSSPFKIDQSDSQKKKIKVSLHLLRFFFFLVRAIKNSVFKPANKNQHTHKKKEYKDTGGESVTGDWWLDTDWIRGPRPSSQDNRPCTTSGQHLTQLPLSIANITRVPAKSTGQRMLQVWVPVHWQKILGNEIICQKILPTLGPQMLSLQMFQAIN